MACVTWYKPTTNIEDDQDLFELLTEVNGFSPNELFIEHHTAFKKKVFRTERLDWYRIYWDVGYGEYQQIMMGEVLHRSAIMAYLLGLVSGYEIHKEVVKDNVEKALQEIRGNGSVDS